MLRRRLRQRPSWICKTRRANAPESSGPAPRVATPTHQTLSSPRNPKQEQRPKEAETEPFPGPTAEEEGSPTEAGRRWEPARIQKNTNRKRQSMENRQEWKGTTAWEEEVLIVKTFYGLVSFCYIWWLFCFLLSILVSFRFHQRQLIFLGEKKTAFSIFHFSKKFQISIISLIKRLTINTSN